MSEYFDENGCPIKCTKCNSKNIKHTTRAVEQGHVCEASIDCGNCGADLGYYAYGSYDPFYQKEFEGFDDV